MVALMLHHAGMEAFRLTLDPRAVRTEAGIADAGEARDHPRKARHGEAGLPSLGPFIGERDDLGPL